MSSIIIDKDNYMLYYRYPETHRNPDILDFK